MRSVTWNVMTVPCPALEQRDSTKDNIDLINNECNSARMTITDREEIL